MIEENERLSLINYRLRQADDTIELAKFLISSGRLAVAVNRIYYGMYYALTSLALKHEFETSKHAQLLGWFNKEFIATGILDKRFGKILRNAFQNRTKGDYDAFIDFEIDEVEIMYTEMVDFIKAVRELVEDKIPNSSNQ